jgi:energy-coupling factor transporter ATP-binding protein EcfA2
VSGFVELCGAPGVGKSTLARTLAGRTVELGDSRVRFIPASRLSAVPREALAPVSRLLRRPSIVSRLSMLPLVADTLYRASPMDAVDAPGVGRLLAALSADVHPVPEDVRSEPGYRARSVQWALMTHRLVMLAAALPQDVVALLDEGVVQRTLSLVGARSSTEQRRRALDLFGAPRAVVHLVGTSDLIARRASQRLAAGAVPQLHRSRGIAEVTELVLEDARAIAETVGVLAASGVPVIEERVDGSLDVGALASRVRDGLSCLRG